MQLRSARGRLLWGILLLIAFPAINQQFNIIKSAPLNGITYNSKPAFSWHAWWDQSYQSGLEKYCNDFIGFRPDMIRTVNQINFTFFHKINTANVIMGYHHNLHYWDYIESYCGMDYRGDNFPLESLGKLKKIQDTLQKMGKLFIMIHAGSKASYFADDIPHEYICNSGGKTNLKNYVRIADSLGINQIDFNSWMASLRGKKPHDLFNKQGIHWNMYGAYFAIDSLITYIENAKKIHMPHPHVIRIDRSYKARRSEDDIESILNLIFPTDTTAYWYPEIQYDNSPGLVKPKVIYIGDSFVWTFMYDGIFEANTDPEYWHYFRDVVFKNYDDGSSYKLMANYDWQGAIKKADCIIMMFTSTQMVLASNEFIDKAYNYYYPANINSNK